MSLHAATAEVRAQNHSQAPGFPARTGKIIPFPQRSETGPSYRSLVERHRAARAAYVSTYWALNDRPAADPVYLILEELRQYSDANNFSSRVIYSKNVLTTAVRAYLAHCRKLGYFEHRASFGKPIPFNDETLRAYRREIKNSHRTLEDRAVFKSNAERFSGHTKAKEDHKTANYALRQTFRDLREYIAERASQREIGLFANYIRAVYNNDFDAHREELTKRRNAGRKGLPSLDDIVEIVDGDQIWALEAVAKGCRRLAVTH